MSNPTTTHSSITGSSGSDSGPAGAELKHSFKVETETMHLFHHVASDASWPSSSSDDSLPAPHTLIAGSTWPHRAWVCTSAAKATPLLPHSLPGRSPFVTDKGSGSQLLQWKDVHSLRTFLPQDLVWMSFETFFFFTTFYLFVCLAVSVLTKAHPWWMLKKKSPNVLGYICIIFNGLSTRAKDVVDSPLFDGLSTSVSCSLNSPLHHKLCSII